MEDIPQPSASTYDVGDTVKVHIGRDDPDARYDGTICEIIHVFEDDLDVHTGRSMDSSSYRLRDIKTGDKLPVSFRNRDLIPAERDD